MASAPLTFTTSVPQGKESPSRRATAAAGADRAAQRDERQRHHPPRPAGTPAIGMPK